MTKSSRKVFKKESPYVAKRQPKGLRITNFKETFFVPYFARRLLVGIRLRKRRPRTSLIRVSLPVLIKLSVSHHRQNYVTSAKELPYSEYEESELPLSGGSLNQQQTPISVRCHWPVLSFNDFGTKFVSGGLLTGRTPINYRPSLLVNQYQMTNRFDQEKLTLEKKSRLLTTKHSEVVTVFQENTRKPQSNYYNNGIRSTQGKVYRYVEAPNLYQNVERRDLPTDNVYARLKAKIYLIHAEYESTWLSFDTRALWGQIFKKLLRKAHPPTVDEFLGFKNVPQIYYTIDKRVNSIPFVTGYRGRYLQGVNHRWMDLLVEHHRWSTSYRGSIFGFRNWITSQSLTGGVYQQQLRVLTNQYYVYQTWKQNFDHLQSYTQSIHEQLKFKKLRSRRFFQRRVIRLRRAIEKSPLTLEQGIAQQPSTEYYRVNRQPTIEKTQLTSWPFVAYLISEARFRLNFKLSTFSAYHYLLFRNDAGSIGKRFWRMDSTRVYRTKSGRTRMRVFQDHPLLGRPNKLTRTNRLAYLTRFLDRRRIKKRLKQSEITPVHQWGNNFYCSLIDTRRKLDVDYPEDRRAGNFFFSFIGGYTTEKKQKKVFTGTLGNFSSFNRTSTITETLMSTREHPPEELLETIEDLKQLPLPIVEKSVPLQRVLGYYFWFYLGRPLWWVYYFYAYNVNRLLNGGLTLGATFFDEVLGFVRFYRRIFRRVRVRIRRRVSTFVRSNRLLRIGTWIYTSWVYLDLLNNDRYALTHSEVETSSLDYEDEDVNYDLDYDTEEDDRWYNLGYDEVDQAQFQPTLFGNPLFEWYIQSVPTDAIEELLDDASYVVRFVVRPLTDLLCRLPIWLVLDWCSLWSKLLKAEFNRTWYKILTHRNTPTKIKGRWYKIPLILVRLGVSYLAWGWVFIYLLELIQPDDIKMLIQYKLGLTWFEEYYFVYVCVAFVGSALLVGPRSLKKFINGLGLDSVFYVLSVETILATPEGYQPDRPMTKFGKSFEHLTVRFAEKHEGMIFLPVNSRSIDDLPNQITSFDDLRAVSLYLSHPSNVNGGGDIPGNCLDPNQDYYPRKMEAYTFNLSERDPLRVTSNYYRGYSDRTQGTSNYGQMVDPPYEKRYRTTHSGDYYWNRTIYTRREWPQTPFQHQK